MYEPTAVAAGKHESSPALDALRADEIAASDLGVGLYRLQQWLVHLYRRHLAYQDQEGVVCILPEVAQRFGLGFKDDSAFIAMPPTEVGWAETLDWSHAAMREGRPTLFLVAEPVEIDGVDTPPFGLSFVVPSYSRASALQEHAELELRGFVQREVRWAVSPTPFAAMPLIVVDEDTNVFEAMQKRQLRSSRGAGGR